MTDNMQNVPKLGSETGRPLFHYDRRDVEQWPMDEPKQARGDQGARALRDEVRDALIEFIGNGSEVEEAANAVMVEVAAYRWAEQRGQQAVIDAAIAWQDAPRDIDGRIQNWNIEAALVRALIDYRYPLAGSLAPAAAPREGD